MDQYDAFISHSSSDKLTARLIRGYLRSHNIHSWFDESETVLSDSVSEEDIISRLNPAIESCRYFLWLCSAKM
jgi:TIR domain